MKHSITLLMSIFLFLSFASSCAVENGVKKEEKIRATENMGISLVREGKLRAGLQHLLDAVKLGSENPDLYHELAKVYFDLGEYDLSLANFKKALALRPQFSEALNNMGVLYVKLDELDKALDCFQQAAKDLLYRTPYYAYHNIGSVYYKKGDYSAAIENYKKALSLAPNYVEVYYDLAAAYEALNQLEDAISAYEKAIQLDPKFWSARFNLGKLYLRLGREEEAEEELEAVIKADPRGAMAKDAKRLLSGE